MSENFKSVLVFLGMIFFTQTALAQPKPEIWLPQKTYLQGEPVWFTAVISNPGSKAVVALFREIEDVGVIDPSGKKLAKEFHGELFGSAAWRILPPGGHFRKTFNLTYCFRGTGSDGCLSPGNYTIQFSTSVVDTVKQKASASYSCEPVQFEVKEPEGEEKKVYLQMIEALRVEGKRDLKRASKMRIDLALRFPKSVYAPYLLWDGAGGYRVCQEEKKALPIYRQILSLYPDRQEAVEAVTGIALYHLNSLQEEKAREEMRVIAEHYAGSPIAERAKEILEKNAKGIEYVPPIPINQRNKEKKQ